MNANNNGAHKDTKLVVLRQARHYFLLLALALISLLGLGTISAAWAAPSTTTFTSSTVNPSAVGQATRFYAAVSPATATGTITFKDGGIAIGSATVSGGTATMFKAFDTTGTHNLTATYNGDASYSASTSAVFVQTVNKANTTTALTSSPAPSTNGQSVTLTATLTTTGMPTGTVTFKDGVTTLGTGTLSGNPGVATFTTSTLSTGSHSLTAVYAGSAGYNTSTSAVRTHTVNPPALAATTTTFTSSTVNPSAVGQATRFYAAVSPTSATGTVTFKDGGTALGSATLSGGTATMFKAFDTTGTHNLTATYSGDTSHSTSTSSAYVQTVNKANTTTALTSSSNPATSGQSITLTATLATTGMPTGTVTFKDGATTLGTGTLTGNPGVATYATSALSTGTHSLTAVYAGSAGYNASTSSALSQTINAPAGTLPNPPTSPAPVVNYEYDAQGNPTKTVQAPGVSGFNFQSVTTYDSLSRPKDSTDPKLGVTQFAYNGREDITQVTDPRNLVTQYPRNGLGDTTQLISPDTGAASHTYDAAGNLKTRTDARGVLSTYTYDSLNRLTQRVHSKTGMTTQTYDWTYDQTGTGYANGIGRVTSNTFPNGSGQYTYDAQGRLTSVLQRVNATTGANSSQISKTVAYGYTNGVLTSITYPSGRKLTLTYTAGQVTALALAKDASSTPTTLISQITYEPFGPASSWQWQMASGAQAHTRVFDTSGRVVRYPLGNSIRDVSYDAADRITAYTHYDVTTAAPQTSLNQSFGYDENGRVTSVTANASSWSIGYDANSNRTSVTLNGTARTYTTPATSNKLSSVSNPTRNFTYDNAGNTTADSGNYSATYDAAGRVATLTKSGVTTTYDYNGQGQRVRKFSSSGASSTVIFVHDQEGHLLGEYDNTGQAIREYVWLGDTPVVVFTPDTVVSNPPIVYYIHADHLDTPRVVVNKSSQLRWRWMSEPFGTTAPETNPASLGAFTFNLRMPGQYADSESGLFYNYFRSYESTTGRYTQSDPIGLEGGINTYAYVEGDPLSLVDPEGFGAIPKNFGRGKPLPEANKLPDHVKRDAERRQGKGQDAADAVKCYFGLKNCEAENELKKARKCLTARCTSTCPPSTFTVDYRAQTVVFDPSTTTCECIFWGLNPDYRGGPPPGLTPPGR